MQSFPGNEYSGQTYGNEYLNANEHKSEILVAPLNLKSPAPVQPDPMQVHTLEELIKANPPPIRTDLVTSLFKAEHTPSQKQVLDPLIKQTSPNASPLEEEAISLRKQIEEMRIQASDREAHEERERLLIEETTRKERKERAIKEAETLKEKEAQRVDLKVKTSLMAKATAKRAAQKEEEEERLENVRYEEAEKRKGEAMQIERDLLEKNRERETRLSMKEVDIERKERDLKERFATLSVNCNVQNRINKEQDEEKSKIIREKETLKKEVDAFEEVHKRAQAKLENEKHDSEENMESDKKARDFYKDKYKKRAEKRVAEVQIELRDMEFRHESDIQHLKRVHMRNNNKMQKLCDDAIDKVKDECKKGNERLNASLLLRQGENDMLLEELIDLKSAFEKKDKEFCDSQETLVKFKDALIFEREIRDANEISELAALKARQTTNKETYLSNQLFSVRKELETSTSTLDLLRTLEEERTPIIQNQVLKTKILEQESNNLLTKAGLYVNTESKKHDKELEESLKKQKAQIQRTLGLIAKTSLIPSKIPIIKQ